MDLNLPKRRAVLSPASAWKRLLAFAIDLIILDFTILAPFSVLFQRLIPSGQGMGIIQYVSYIQGNASIANRLYFLAFFAMIPVILYFAILEYKLGQTLGKIIMNIAVLPEAKEMKFWQCIVRSIELIPLPPFVFLIFIDPLFLLIRNQRLSEMLSGTNTYERIVL